MPYRKRKFYLNCQKQTRLMFDILRKAIKAVSPEIRERFTEEFAEYAIDEIPFCILKFPVNAILITVETGYEHEELSPKDYGTLRQTYSFRRKQETDHALKFVIDSLIHLAPRETVIRLGLKKGVEKGAPGSSLPPVKKLVQKGSPPPLKSLKLENLIPVNHLGVYPNSDGRMYVFQNSKNGWMVKKISPKGEMAHFQLENPDDFFLMTAPFDPLKLEVVLKEPFLEILGDFN